MKSSLKSNHLINEKSPYLLQHAHNPVDWYSWKQEAFDKAKREDKPIFLSIGYSTCHWCHVMEKESFEDEEVATLLNENFVCIKVDREERPDIDNMYMTVCQMITGTGGWPLTIIMTPDKKPFFAATYIPKKNRFGLVGMLDLIPRINDVWEKRKNEILTSADEIIKSLKNYYVVSKGKYLNESILRDAYGELLNRYDDNYGGFGNPPKFPTPHNLLFLLRYWKRTGHANALQMVEKTLNAMRMGGIWDHVGFGFHRYSTDEFWLIPHYEKMLYDQAMLAMAYTEIFQATGKEEYKDTAKQIFEYVLRDMRHPEGGFYSAEDADSEGEEGKFYLWTEREIKEALGDESELIIKIFNVSKEGNYMDEIAAKRTKKNILHLKKPLSEWARELKIPLEDLNRQMEKSTKKLFELREKRVHPQKDDKILTDWNGLMIAALAKAAKVFNNEDYIKAAKLAVEFILNKMVDHENCLFHRYREGEAAIFGFLDDYTFYVWGLLELYETTFEVKYLQKAIEFNQYTIEHFWDKENGGFYTTSDSAESLLVRQKVSYDGAIPSGNSVAMLNLLRLARICGDNKLETKSAELGKAFSKDINNLPSSHTQLLAAFDFVFGPSFEVVIVGDLDSADMKKMIRALRENYTPNKVVIHRPLEKSPDITKISPFTKDMNPIDNKATAYVCQNYSCNQPTKDPLVMLKLLNVKKN